MSDGELVSRRRPANKPSGARSASDSGRGGMSGPAGSGSGGWGHDNDDKEDEGFKDVFDVPAGARVDDSILTLLEQLTLLSIQETDGVLNFYLSDDEAHMRFVLRAAILVELALRNRIQLEPSRNNLSIFDRAVVVKNPEMCNDDILDEALKLIIATEEPENVQQWLNLLNGDAFNIFKSHYHIKNLRMRIRKSLYDKGILSLGSTNIFGIISHATYSISNSDAKDALVKNVHGILLKECPADITRMEPRKLALLTMSHSCRVLETAFEKLNDRDYEKVFKRLQAITDMDCEQVGVGHGTAWEIIWTCIGCCLAVEF